jgi:hypothetical protein
MEEYLYLYESKLFTQFNAGKIDYDTYMKLLDKLKEWQDYYYIELQR